MYTCNFDFADNQNVNISAIDNLINTLMGDFKKRNTKDGWFYNGSFKSQEQLDLFEKKLRVIAPQIFE